MKTWIIDLIVLATLYISIILLVFWSCYYGNETDIDVSTTNTPIQEEDLEDVLVPVEIKLDDKSDTYTDSDNSHCEMDINQNGILFRPCGPPNKYDEDYNDVLIV